MNDFSLIATVRSVIEETDLASPQEIADKVIEMVPRAKIRAALIEALPYLVQTELGRQRMSSPAGPAPSGATRPRAVNQSSKVRALRQYADAWRAKLRMRVAIGHGEWKLLADCTAADFRIAADRRRAHAAGALSNAIKYEAYAAALDEHEVTRFADLPEDVQASLLGAEESAA